MNNTSIDKKGGIKTENIIGIVLVMGIIIKTVLLYPYIVDGDLQIYNKLYDLVNNKNIVDGYITYTANINSAEFGHYLLIWISSNLEIPRVIFLGISNGILGYLAVKIYYKSNKYIIVSMLLLFNIYADILYFSAERLKFSVIFILAAMECKKLGNKTAIAVSAVVTHVQAALIILITKLVEVGGNAFGVNKKVDYRNLLVVVLMIVLVGQTQLMDHAIKKFIEYNIDYGGGVPYKTILMSAILVVVAPQKVGATLASTITIAVAYLLGDGRLNFVLYYIIIFLCITRGGGLKYSLMVMLMTYGAYQDVLFIRNIITQGTGFNEDGGI